jgi:hypothetical protein
VHIIFFNNKAEWYSYAPYNFIVLCIRTYILKTGHSPLSLLGDCSCTMYMVGRYMYLYEVDQRVRAFGGMSLFQVEEEKQS